MKKLVVLLIIAAFVFGSTAAFAATTERKMPPGDGGFFTNYFNGILGDSWTNNPPQPRKTPQTTANGIKQREKTTRRQW